MIEFLRRMKVIDELERYAKTREGAEREGLEAAVKLERVKLCWPYVPLGFFAVFYSGALAAWGFALEVSILRAALAGAVIGLAIAFTFCLSPITKPIETLEQLKGAQLYLSGFLRFAILIGIFGISASVIRALA